MNLVQILKRCEVFVGLSDSDLEKIASLPSWHRHNYRTGQVIFREDTDAKDFYIVEEGTVSLAVALHQEGEKKLTLVRVDTVTKGDVFGWSSLIPPHSRNMSAICVRPSTVISVSGAELNELMDRNHVLGYEVMKSLVRVIARRLRDIHAKLPDKKTAAEKRKTARVATS
ncbi:MAG: cyclic nucleotide-binding domain-containing protein [Chloroflexi bacterium]|nr:cyclic nucleotide-binding domain-containing protein [Chloroflexota bacterium]